MISIHIDERIKTSNKSENFDKKCDFDYVTNLAHLNAASQAVPIDKILSRTELASICVFIGFIQEKMQIAVFDENDTTLMKKYVMTEENRFDITKIYAPKGTKSLKDSGVLIISKSLSQVESETKTVITIKSNEGFSEGQLDELLSKNPFKTRYVFWGEVEIVKEEI